MVYRLIYASTVDGPLFAEKLDRILLRSRISNRQARISGLLLFQAGRFIQLLEGPEAAVVELAAKIARDRQHRDFRVIASGPASARAFPDEPLAYLATRYFGEEQREAFERLSSFTSRTAGADELAREVEMFLARFRQQQTA